MKKQKLELTWIGKDERPKLEPRILLEDAGKSYHAKTRAGENDIFDNRLIFGDNLLALKALEQEFAGKLKCVFIDPPYNTGSAFEHYDDGIEHSLWLSLIRERLQIIQRLLTPDGSIWIAIDDNECHYLKVLCDEIFGRSNFLANIVWQSKDTPGNNAVAIAETHNHILVYRREDAFRPNLLERNEKQLANYNNPDKDSRGPWLAAPLTRAEFRERDFYPLINPAGKSCLPPKGSSWRRPPEKMKWLQEDNRIWWGKKGEAEFPMEKKFLSEAKPGVTNQTWWSYEFAGSTRNASAEMKGLFDGTKAFDTPKPEKLIQRVLEIATNPGDLVLDSFAGSGTTGAVAHKMGRRWIMVELGEHCHTHIIPRLTKVIDGEDKGGISEAVNWQGGGGFRYYRLAPSLLDQDSWGNWVISKDYNSAMLAEAVCKLNGFTYAPSETHFWQHGYSTERDFIYVTTQTLTREQLAKISEEVGDNRSLLVCCGAFRVKPEMFPNLTLRKIPKAVLSQCEWGKDDYSLKINELPVEEPKAVTTPIETKVEKQGRTKKERRASTVSNQSQMGLFERSRS
jgi:adenine-specific DNA-methyltransferase